jgi:hypothetical protein
VEAQQCVKLSLTNRSIGLIHLVPPQAGEERNIVASSDKPRCFAFGKASVDRRFAKAKRRESKRKRQTSIKDPAPVHHRLAVAKRRAVISRLAVAKRLARAWTTWWLWRGVKHPIPSRTRP